MNKQAIVQAEQPRQQDEAATILALIERVATNPEANLDNMQKLLDMRQQVVAAEAEREFAAAMNRAQARMERIAQDSHNPQTRSRYTSYAGLDRAIRPIYTSEGFSVSFDTDQSATVDVLVLLCYVSHAAGHTRTYRLAMPADGKGAKGGDVMTKTHATGAAMTYGRRYLLGSVFNVAFGSDDNDGNAPRSTARRAEAANFDAESRRLEEAATLDELAEAWDAIGPDARHALAAVKDARKRVLQLHGGKGGV